MGRVSKIHLVNDVHMVTGTITPNIKAHMLTLC